MPVVFARVDERLVHGQITTSWSKHLRLEQIIIIDDATAKDPFMKEVLASSAPKNLVFTILSTDEINQIDKYIDKRTMLLFKTVKTALETLRKGFDLTELNIGNTSSGPNRRKISKNVHLSDEEIDIVKELMDSDVKVFLQMLHTDKVTNLKDKI